MSSLRITGPGLSQGFLKIAGDIGLNWLHVLIGDSLGTANGNGELIKNKI